ncbi:hypothetical protein OKA04_00090 [Luteolibacter flavescens]|uniref:Uncharacterized protein n=1 Tax=Luteolibacter flavescens TaxID=1859460 RepID=A0ABT3FHR5_9BACT|nr:hypothetical protein [Luteolibacter flavescens]MCW1883106.1 hypothetical protein [Luteolibacter flavescens]
MPHDDGVFEFQKKLEHSPVGIAEFAQDVISAFRIKEQERVRKLKKPITTPRGIPLEVVMEDMRKRAGTISHASTQLHHFDTKYEHQNTKRLDAFVMHAEPVYSSLAVASKHHESYCWKVALLNAFRVLDLMGESNVEFPFDWIHLDVRPSDSNFAGLLSSASFQMGFYYAKAQAMRNATVMLLGRQMSNGRKGHQTPMGQIIHGACEEILIRGESLIQKNISRRVMQILEEQGKGSTQNARYEIWVGDQVEVVNSKKLGKFIRDFRDKLL